MVSVNHSWSFSKGSRRLGRQPDHNPIKEFGTAKFELPVTTYGLRLESRVRSVDPWARKTPPTTDVAQWIRSSPGREARTVQCTIPGTGVSFGERRPDRGQSCERNSPISLRKIS
jgi:hypothetical protein